MFWRSVARSVLLICICAPGAALRAQAPAATSPDISPVAITHVTVIDVITGRRSPDRTVLVERNRITSVAPGTTVRLPAGARSIDGRGKYLIPGLWDMHVHFVSRIRGDTAGEVVLPLLLANGVTGMRDLGTTFADLARWRALERAHQLLPVRLVASGPILDGIARGPYFMRIRTANEGRAAVDTLHAHGVDLVKFYEGLPHDAFVAIVDEAHRLRLRTAGHPPIAAHSLAEISDLVGAGSLEHFWGMMLAGSAREDSLRMLAAAIVDTATHLGPVSRVQVDIESAAESTFAASRLTAASAQLARNGTFVTPTFVTFRMHTSFVDGDSTGGDAAHWSAMSPFLRDIYAEGGRADARRGTVSGSHRMNALRHAIEPLAGPVARAGVRFLAGTDNAPVPGFALQRELTLLVENGLTPLQALQAATINPARYLGATDSLGTIAPGKLADLVLLDGNPLTDIHNTQRIRAVIANGRVFDRAALDELLRDVARGVPTPR